MTEHRLARRDFLRAGGVVAGAGVLAGLGLFDDRADAASPSMGSDPGYQQPNIVFILLDETRFPSVFPEGIHNAGEFLAAHMPNLYELWANGVKFRHHYSSGVACSPGRSTIVSGLYPHQAWMLQTRKGSGAQGPPAPALKPIFPTYGRLLRDVGYATPYVGKWHLSDSPMPGSPLAPGYLDDYGFEGLTIPDIVGVNGDGATFDGSIAATAMNWLKGRKNNDGPFCLTVSFVNSHDREYFWGGIYNDTFNQLYDDAGLTPQADFGGPVPSEQNPQRQGYPTVPPNWESSESIRCNKPSSQYFARKFTELVWGGIGDEPSQTDFELVEYPLGDPTIQGAYAPYSFWEQGLDSYTQIMNTVDGHIGDVIASLPPQLRHNTIFVMTSDHGDFSGAHGFPANKAGTVYEEAFNVPLIVADPRGRFTGETEIVRNQMTASVDLLPMLATLGWGSQDWMTGDLATIYQERLNLLPLLQSNSASGRDHLVMATDEVVPGYFNFNNSPRYILGLRTEDAKLGVYADWIKGTATIDPSTIELEFYDYTTEGGRLELDNCPDDPRAKAMLDQLLTQYLPQQMEAPLPAQYGTASALARAQFLLYVAALDALTSGELTNRSLGIFTPFGNPF